MEKATLASLQFDKVLDLILPAGEAGKHQKHHLRVFRPGQEASVRKEFSRLDDLVAALSKNNKLSGQLSSALSQTPYLPQTLKALTQRPLMLHEFFELKKLLYHAIQLQLYCTKAGLTKQYPFPELQKVFDLLDPGHSQSPSFALSGAFDPALAELLIKQQDLQMALRREEQKLLNTAKKTVGTANPTSEIVVSRLDEKQVRKLQASGFYRLSDENFANLTFRLQDSPELADIKKQLANLVKKLGKTGDHVMITLSKKLQTHSKILLQTTELVQRLDWDFAKAIFAMQCKCVIPKISAKVQIVINKAVNLPLQLSMAGCNCLYQPLDLKFSTPVNVLTGPNMGGKTTTLQTLGQLYLMAVFVIPVPAATAELCLFDQIWHNRETAGGENLSSFGREAVSLANALDKKGRTLYLMDELAKGTNPQEGEAILTATLHHLSDQPCLVLAATHYDLPVRLEKASQFAIRGIDAKALQKLAKAGKTTLEAQLGLLNSLMDYSLVRVTEKTTPPQNAIPIAQLLGLPEAIIRKAKTYIKH
jgi:DNA mismatch repair protein MutS2